MNKNKSYFLTLINAIALTCCTVAEEEPDCGEREPGGDPTWSVTEPILFLNDEPLYGGAYIEAFEMSESPECVQIFDNLKIFASSKDGKERISINLKFLRDQNIKNIPVDQEVGYGMSTWRRSEQLSFLYTSNNVSYSSHEGQGTVSFSDEDNVSFSLTSSLVPIITGLPFDPPKLVNISGKSSFSLVCHNKKLRARPCQSWEAVNSMDGYGQDHLNWLQGE